VNRPISIVGLPAITNLNRPVKGGSGVLGSPLTRQLVPSTVIQVGYLLKQADAITMLEVEQPVEIPMEVVSQIGDLLPQVIGRITA